MTLAGSARADDIPAQPSPPSAAPSAAATDPPEPMPPPPGAAPPPVTAPPATVALSPTSATDGSPHPYRFHVGLEIPLIAFGAATLLTAFVPSTPAPCLPNCEVPSTMNALDRQALGARSPAAGTIADIALAALMVTPHVANLVGTRGRQGAWLEDLLVSAEAILIATGTSQVMKTGMGRYSPRVYDSTLTAEQRSHPESTRSFWSSHTATATAAATSFAVSYWLRHPRSPWRWVVLGGLEATALGVGLMTILAGWHFPTDVAAGALFGAASGVAVPMLHTVW